MKGNVILFVFVLLFFSTVWMGYSSGYAASELLGATGAPKVGGGKETTCQECHGTGGQNTIQTTTTIEVLDTTTGNKITSYLPDNIYKARVTVNKVFGTPKGYGFQMVSLIDNGNLDVKGWSNPAANVNIISLTSGQKRSYVEQPKVSTSNIFETNWKAPAAKSGKVTFYASGNGVNANGSTGGDGASVSTLSLTEGTVATTDLAVTEELKIFPALATDWINYQITLSHSSLNSLKIINLNGITVDQKDIDLKEGINEGKLEISNLPKGLYFLQISNGRSAKIQKFVKVL